MKTRHQHCIALAALGLAFLAGCTATTPSKPEAPAKPMFTAETLPEACKKLVTNMKGCTDVMKDAPGMANFCIKRVNERDAPACPIPHDEAKKILAGK